MLNKENLRFLIDEEIYNIPSEIKEKELPKQVETPEKTPILDVQPVTNYEFGFFHNNENEEAIQLLDKIITACKLSSERYKIFNGSSMVGACQRAIVFTDQPKNYYSWNTYKEKTKLLFAISLQQLAQSQEDKAKLWKALQEVI